MVAEVGSETFRSSASGGFMQIFAGNFANHSLTLSSSYGGASTDSGNISDATIIMIFSDAEMNLFFSDSLPPLIDLIDFLGANDQAYLRVTNGTFAAGGSMGTANAPISSMSITKVGTVPLPVSVLFLLTGLGGLVVLQRRKAE